MNKASRFPDYYEYDPTVDPESIYAKTEATIDSIIAAKRNASKGVGFAPPASVNAPPVIPSGKDGAFKSKKAARPKMGGF